MVLPHYVTWLSPLAVTPQVLPKLNYLLEYLVSRPSLGSALSLPSRYMAGVPSRGRPNPLDPFLASRDEENARRNATGRCLPRVSIEDVVSLRDAGGRRRLLASLCRRSRLVEPTYKEVVVLWRPQPLPPPPPALWRRPRLRRPRLRRAAAAPPPPPPSRALQMRLYEEVPIANYAVVLPESKLTFRGTDALRLDAVTLLSLSVLFVQFFVRRIGSGAAPGGGGGVRLLFGGSAAALLLRTFFGYSNARNRYDLFASRFVTSHIATTGTAVARYLRWQADLQRARRAGLLLHLLSEKGGTGTVAARGAGGVDGVDGAGGAGGVVEALPPALGAAGVRAGLQDLERLGLVQRVQGLGRPGIEVATSSGIAEDQLAATRALPPTELASALRRYWGTLLPTMGDMGGGGLTPQGGSSEARDWDAGEFSGVDV